MYTYYFFFFFYKLYNLQFYLCLAWPWNWNGERSQSLGVHSDVTPISIQSVALTNRRRKVFENTIYLINTDGTRITCSGTVTDIGDEEWTEQTVSVERWGASKLVGEGFREKGRRETEMRD